MTKTTAEYRKALRYQYSKQGEDIGVIGILDDLDEAMERISWHGENGCVECANLLTSLKEKEPMMTQAKAGRVIEESSHSYEPSPCVRVTTCCGWRVGTDGACKMCDDPEGFKCATHGGPWPDESVTGNCPARTAEIRKVWNRARRLESEPSP